MKKRKRHEPIVFFSAFKAMWYAKNIFGDETWSSTQEDAEKFAGFKFKL